jgi:SAM-dependent methyltransferase
MATPEDHYRNLLAHHYSWMFGLSFEEKVAEQQAILEPLLRGAPRGFAVDLGSGPGYQSLALAELGYEKVLAIDTSAELLSELEGAVRTYSRPNVQTHNADMLSLLDYVRPGAAAAVVCMGDTLTHLASPGDVRRLFGAVATALAADGVFVVTWRDLTQELMGMDRFIPIRSDEDRILTCFLEYVSPSTVQVHDLMYARDSTKKTWALTKSSYPKLRLGAGWVAEELAAAGFDAGPARMAGRLCLLCAKRAAS